MFSQGSIKSDDLIRLVSEGRADILEDLIKSDDRIDLNQVNEFGNSPVLEAAARNDLKILQLLVSVGGADIDVSDAVGQTPFTWADYHKNDDMRTYLKGVKEERENIANQSTGGDANKRPF